jgi:bidirectional [NiFe] hydrogenase diaphorase subunit
MRWFPETCTAMQARTRGGVAGDRGPTADERWLAVLDTMRRNGFRGDALIETLHTVQNVFGFLDRATLLRVADALNVAPSRVQGVATFYHFFRLEPPGAHRCAVCTGTACHIGGSEILLDHVRARYGLHAVETTPDGTLSLQTVRCIGACALAPVVTLDGSVLAHAGVASLDRHLDDLTEP